MKIEMESKIWDKIVRTLMSVDRNAKFECTDEGTVRITSFAEGLSCCRVNVQKGWTESADVEGVEGESFVIDLQQAKDILQNVREGRSDIIKLVSKPDEPVVSFVGQVDKKVPKIEIEVPAGLSVANEQQPVRFRMIGPKLKRVLNEIFSTDDTVCITLGLYKVRAEMGTEEPVDIKGYGVCLWKPMEDINEVFISNEPLSQEAVKLPESYPDGFTTRYYVEPVTKDINEISTAKKENVEISFGPESPVGIKFRLAETVFVECDFLPVLPSLNESKL